MPPALGYQWVLSGQSCATRSVEFSQNCDKLFTSIVSAAGAYLDRKKKLKIRKHHGYIKLTNKNQITSDAKAYDQSKYKKILPPNS